MTTDAPALSQDSLASLLAAALTAAGPIPVDEAKVPDHLSRVERIAFDLADTRLARINDRIALRHEIRTDKREIPARILAVTESKGRAIITFKPYVGTPDQLSDPNFSEEIRTPFLNTPDGNEIYTVAKALIGADARIGKVFEVIENGPKKGQKVRIAAYVDPAVSAHAEVPVDAPADTTPAPAADTPAPAPAPVAESAPVEEEPFDSPVAPEPAATPEPEAEKVPTTGAELKAAAEGLGLGVDDIKAVANDLNTEGLIGPPSANRPPAEMALIWQRLKDRASAAV